LIFSPTKPARDTLYKAGVNPVSSFTGQGTVLFGDKTHQSRPSSFDRINVRRLMIHIEKQVGRAARSLLFEFNDEFTRASFVNMVTPTLRQIQGRRGIQDFLVICDTSNNTTAVVEANQFVGSVLIKPNYSVNFIQLNFVAVRTGVAFSEIVL
jgi:phage tail sheath protein FI